jgi:hypothetical protein
VNMTAARIDTETREKINITEETGFGLAVFRK